jgi:hypothetical protein
MAIYIVAGGYVMKMDGSKQDGKDDFESADAPALHGITSCAGVNTEGAASVAKPPHITDEFNGAGVGRGSSQQDAVYTRPFKSVLSEKKNNDGGNIGDGENIKAAITGDIVLFETSKTDGDDLDPWGGMREASRDAWIGLEEALGLEFADDETESSKNSDDDHDDDNNISTREAWIRLEEALGLELASDDETESSRDGDDDDNNSQCRVGSSAAVMSSGEPSEEVPSTEELTNAEANSLNHDIDEVIRENAVVSTATAELTLAAREVEEGDGEAPRAAIKSAAVVSLFATYTCVFLHNHAIAHCDFFLSIHCLSFLVIIPQSHQGPCCSRLI